MKKAKPEIVLAKVMQGGRIRLPDAVKAAMGVQDGEHVVFYVAKGVTSVLLASQEAALKPSPLWRLAPLK